MWLPAPDCSGNLLTSPMSETNEASLAGRLQARVAAEGPISFAQFMESALYDPAEGFYARVPVGEKGDFVTSPHVSPVFGRLVAVQVTEFWKLLGQPHPFSLIEAGAGDGTLARQILQALPSEIRDATRYTAVERSAAARSALQGAGVVVAAGLEAIDRADAGCLVANELLDNLPFHRVRGTSRGVVELFVGMSGGRLVLKEGPLTEEAARLAPVLSPGQEAVVSPAALDFLDQAAGMFRAGYLWLVDYAAPPGDLTAQVHGYRRHRVEEDVLEHPGSRDITAGVDFEALARHARGRGLSVWGPVPQRDVLISLGFRRLDQTAQARQVAAIGSRRGIEALRTYSDRNRANLLLSPAGLGGFSVLCIGVGVNQPPPSFGRADTH